MTNFPDLRQKGPDFGLRSPPLGKGSISPTSPPPPPANPAAALILLFVTKAHLQILLPLPTKQYYNFINYQIVS